MQNFSLHAFEFVQPRFSIMDNSSNVYSVEIYKEVSDSLGIRFTLKNKDGILFTFV